MQRQQIEKLKKDNDRLKEELALETRQAKLANNMSASAQIAKLQDQADMFSRKIAAEKQRVEDLDKKKRKLEAQLMEQMKDISALSSSHAINAELRSNLLSFQVTNRRKPRTRTCRSRFARWKIGLTKRSSSTTKRSRTTKLYARRCCY